MEKITEEQKPEAALPSEEEFDPYKTEAENLEIKMSKLRETKNSLTINTLIGIFAGYLRKKYPGTEAISKKFEFSELPDKKLDWRYCRLYHKMTGSSLKFKDEKVSDNLFLDFPEEDSVAGFIDKLSNFPAISLEENMIAENLKNEYLGLMEKKGAAQVHKKTDEFLSRLREKHQNFKECLLCGILWNTISGDEFTIPTFYDFEGEDSIRGFIQKLKADLPDKK